MTHTLAIAANKPQWLKTGFVVQGHILLIMDVIKRNVLRDAQNISDWDTTSSTE